MASERGTEAQDTREGESKGHESKFKGDADRSDGCGEVMDMTTFLSWFTQ